MTSDPSSWFFAQNSVFFPMGGTANVGVGVRIGECRRTPRFSRLPALDPHHTISLLRMGHPLPRLSLSTLHVHPTSHPSSCGSVQGNMHWSYLDLFASFLFYSLRHPHITRFWIPNRSWSHRLYEYNVRCAYGRFCFMNVPAGCRDVRCSGQISLEFMLAWRKFSEPRGGCRK